MYVQALSPIILQGSFVRSLVIVAVLCSMEWVLGYEAQSLDSPYCCRPDLFPVCPCPCYCFVIVTAVGKSAAPFHFLTKQLQTAAIIMSYVVCNIVGLYLWTFDAVNSATGWMAMVNSLAREFLYCFLFMHKIFSKWFMALWALSNNVCALLTSLRFCPLPCRC